MNLDDLVEIIPGTVFRGIFLKKELFLILIHKNYKKKTTKTYLKL